MTTALGKIMGKFVISPKILPILRIKMGTFWEKYEKNPMIFRSVEHPLIKVNYMLIMGSCIFIRTLLSLK